MRLLAVVLLVSSAGSEAARKRGLRPSASRWVGASCGEQDVSKGWKALPRKVLFLLRGGATRDDGGYYARLGIRPTATEDEIKKAYRSLARKQHPDKGGDEEQFKLLNEAYSVLSDASTRRAYDRYGVAGVDPNGAAAAAARSQDGQGGGFGGSQGGVDARTAQQMFEQMFGSFGGAFGDAFGGASPFGFAGGPRRAPRRFAITVSLDDCYQGRTISVSLGDETCRVRVEPGMGEGDVIRASLGGSSVYFELREAPHPVFKRSNADLLVDASIPIADALGGAPRVTIKRLDGTALRVNVAPLNTVLRHGALRAIDGEGMPIKGSPSRRGRLFVRVFVVFPSTLELDQRDRATLRSLLGAPPRKIDDFDSRLRTLKEADAHEWGRSGANFGSGTSGTSSDRRRPRQQQPQDDDDDDDGSSFRFTFR